MLVSAHQDEAISLERVTRRFTERRGMTRRTVTAVSDLSLTVPVGSVLGLVGESGSGKTTVSRMMLGLLEPTSGAVRIMGRPVTALRPVERAGLIQPIFQDPFSSLNPRKTILSIVRLPLDIAAKDNVAERERLALDMLESVGLPANLAGRRPAELSGGQRQRVAIARALVLRPRIVVCDEPTSALDVSVQAQILNLLLDLRKALNLTYVVVSHNLAVVRYVATDIAVMRGGRLVETAPATQFFAAPGEPYSRALLAATLMPRVSRSAPVATNGGPAPQ
jgi:peptide/nickel transport system ATP-binding protein